MPADGDIVLRAASPFTRGHRKLGFFAAYAEHFIRRIAIELAMKPADKVR